MVYSAEFVRLGGTTTKSNTQRRRGSGGETRCLVAGTTSGTDTVIVVLYT